MNKIDKLDKELEKAREKAAEWQAKIRELEKQKQEEENSQIVQAVRSLKLTPAQLRLLPLLWRCPFWRLCWYSCLIFVPSC